MYDELTEQDIKKMEEEIEYRKLVVRKEALEAVKEARAQGDLSENFEYHAAKKGQEPEREQNPLSGEDDQDSEDHIHGLRGGRSRNE